jgi:Na+-driven multidrug efflux pump
MLIASYIVLLAGWLIYVPVRWLLAGLTPLSLPILAQTLSWLVLLLVNRSYYRKRREIFSSNDN